MKHFKMLFCCLMVVCLSITHQSVNAQNKRVNEECQNDADCASGKCLTLRNNSRKVCGTCTQDKLNSLSEKVDRACKNKEEMSGSVSNQGEMSMAQIETQIEVCKECIAARKEVLSECFYGNPEEGHVKQLNDWEKALENNIRIKNEKASYRTGYYCSKSDYENYLRYVENYCNKDFQRASEDASRRKQEKGGCSDLENMVKSCTDCVYNYNEFKKNCFRGQMSGKREELLEKYNRNLKEMKEVLDFKKSGNLCN